MRNEENNLIALDLTHNHQALHSLPTPTKLIMTGEMVGQAARDLEATGIRDTRNQIGADKVAYRRRSWIATVKMQLNYRRKDREDLMTYSTMAHNRCLEEQDFGE